jgi:hypothetical protein
VLRPTHDLDINNPIQSQMLANNKSLYFLYRRNFESNALLWKNFQIWRHYQLLQRTAQYSSETLSQNKDFRGDMRDKKNK